MSRINLTAGALRLKSYDHSDTFLLSVEYNRSVIVTTEIRGVDNLYALQHLVNRAIQKLSQ